MKTRFIKTGKLFWFPLDCPDIERFFLRRLFRKFGIPYVPFTLRFYDKLFLREDHTKYNRVLVNFCKKHGIQTFVIQEGRGGKHAYGHLPLFADYFLCPKENYDWWVSQGMPKDRIRIYYRQKKTEDYKGILFLSPLLTWEDFSNDSYWASKNVSAMNIICKFLHQDVVFKPHPKNFELVKRFLPPHRVIDGETEDLIKKYDKVYCFSDNTIRADCQALGKRCVIVDAEEPLKIYNRQRKTKGYKGILFLYPLVVWEDFLSYSYWEGKNASVMNIICKFLHEEVVFKPHPKNADLVKRFLPPHKVVDGEAEDLIKKYDKIYTFSDSSIIVDCEMLGKECELVDIGGRR